MRSTFFAICSAEIGGYTTRMSWHGSWIPTQTMKHFGRRGKHATTIRFAHRKQFPFGWLGNGSIAVARQRQSAKCPGFLDRWRDGSRDFPSLLCPACFVPINMAYGCTSACLGRDGISCLFSVARCFLFGFRLWVLQDRTAPNRAVGEGFGPRIATRNTFYT